LGISFGSVKDHTVSERLEVNQVEEKKDGVVRVVVGLPHEGMTGSEAYTNRLSNFKHLGHLEERGKLLNLNPRFEFYQYTMGRMHGHVAREEMAKHTIAINADYLFMIDDDMIAEDDLFERLYALQKDIVSPLAFTRNFPHRPVMYSCVAGWDNTIQREYFINHSVINYPKKKLVECDAVGFGAVLISAATLRGTPEPRFKNPDTGEDIYFCYHAKKSGFRTFMDTRICIGHVSHPLIITEDYVNNLNKVCGVDVDRHHGVYDKYEKNGNGKEPILLLGD
jgi:hypothetical protein